MTAIGVEKREKVAILPSKPKSDGRRSALFSGPPRLQAGCTNRLRLNNHLDMTAQINFHDWRPRPNMTVTRIPRREHPRHEHQSPRGTASPRGPRISGPVRLCSNRLVHTARR